MTAGKHQFRVHVQVLAQHTAAIQDRAGSDLLSMPIGELWKLDPLAAACAADRGGRFRSPQRR
jgi:hypothetical protein